MVDMERLVAFSGRLQTMIDACIEKTEAWLQKMETKTEACPKRPEAN
jgi:hypothetical protein